MRISKHILLLGAFVALQQEVSAQRFHLFSDEMKKDYPSVVYDFLERYLYETDSIMKKGVDVSLKLHDDKVLFSGHLQMCVASNILNQPIFRSM